MKNISWLWTIEMILLGPLIVKLEVIGEMGWAWLAAFLSLLITIDKSVRDE